MYKQLSYFLEDHIEFKLNVFNIVVIILTTFIAYQYNKHLKGIECIEKIKILRDILRLRKNNPDFLIYRSSSNRYDLDQLKAFYERSERLKESLYFLYDIILKIDNIGFLTESLYNKLFAKRIITNNKKIFNVIYNLKLHIIDLEFCMDELCIFSMKLNNSDFKLTNKIIENLEKYDNIVSNIKDEYNNLNTLLG